jgi:hypothetical protein
LLFLHCHADTFYLYPALFLALTIRLFLHNTFQTVNIFPCCRPDVDFNTMAQYGGGYGSGGGGGYGQSNPYGGQSGGYNNAGGRDGDNGGYGGYGGGYGSGYGSGRQGGYGMYLPGQQRGQLAHRSV